MGEFSNLEKQLKGIVVIDEPSSDSPDMYALRQDDMYNLFHRLHNNGFRIIDIDGIFKENKAYIFDPSEKGKFSEIEMTKDDTFAKIGSIEFYIGYRQGNSQKRDSREFFNARFQAVKMPRQYDDKRISIEIFEAWHWHPLKPCEDVKLKFFSILASISSSASYYSNLNGPGYMYIGGAEGPRKEMAIHFLEKLTSLGKERIKEIGEVMSKVLPADQYLTKLSTLLGGEYEGGPDANVSMLKVMHATQGLRKEPFTKKETEEIADSVRKKK